MGGGGPAGGAGLAVYLAATFLLCLSPGPNVMLCVSLGLRDGPRSVYAGVAGIATASLAFLSVSALGLVAALAAAPRLFAAIRWAGAAYLVWLGVRLLLAGWRAAAGPPPPPGAKPASTPTPGRRIYVQALATHLSNPKAVLFWTALLPQFIDPARPAAPQVVVLGLLGNALDAVVLTAYGLSAAATRRVAPGAGYTHWVDLAAGTFFVIAGTLLAFARLQ